VINNTNFITIIAKLKIKITAVKQFSPKFTQRNENSAKYWTLRCLALPFVFPCMKFDEIYAWLFKCQSNRLGAGPQYE
jgi:hypothetical protein